MKLKEYKTIGEKVYSEKLPNGLSIFVMPKYGFNKSFAFFATNYGGIDRRFKLQDQWIDTPAGVAHFLEHKMFDTKDGNALTMLSEKGASPNAFTAADMTAYHFESTENFEEILKILLHFVSEPYFIQESVQKEQGIIGQEIRMIEDNPEIVVYYNLMKSLFKNNPVRDSVAGTIGSIAEITSDTLYDCHRVFYNPSNMVLCVAGDVNPEAVISIARSILPVEPGASPLRDYGEPERPQPETPKTETFMEVSLPLFITGTKIMSTANGSDLLRQELIAELALDLIAGRSAPLYIKLYREGLLNSSFSASYESVAGAAYVMFGGESRNPEVVKDEIQNEINRILLHGADQKLFERQKKALLGKNIRALNSFDNICYNYAHGYFNGYDAYDTVERLQSITSSDIQLFLQENLNADHFAISIVRPNSEKR